MTRGLPPVGILGAQGTGRAADHTSDRPAERTGDAWGLFAAGVARGEVDETAAILAGELASLESGGQASSSTHAAAVLALAVLLAEQRGDTRLALVPAAVEGCLGAAGAGWAARATAAVEYASDPSSALIGRVASLAQEAPRAPLVVAGGHIYSHKNYWLEQAMARALLRRRSADRRDASAPSALDEATWAAVVHGGPFALSASQASAVRAALHSPLLAISGGPGTGKTAIVLAIVRALGAMGIADVALAAPTGKAANRLQSVLGAGLINLRRPLPSDAALVARPPEARTLHRLLGLRPRTGEFRHGAAEPLPYRVVVVDESSMIDSLLMERLLAALAPDARLILLGDAAQLPSVGAGRCFADLIAWGERLVAGLDGADGADVQPGDALGVRLTESFRMDPADPDGAAVYQAAQAVLARGELGVVAMAPGAALGWRGVEWMALDDANGPHERADLVALAQMARLAEAWWRRLIASIDGFAEASKREYRYDGGWSTSDEKDLERLLAGLDHGKLLTAVRHGPFGAEALNASVHQWMAASSGTTRAEFLPGEPVMFTANDYERQLFNGDAGVVVRVRGGDGGQRFAAVFRVGGALVPFAVEAVRAYLALGWCLTTHKAQGSEYASVALVLPPDASPVATRELVYTALTRARRSVVIAATPQALAAAMAQTGQRATGLLAAIEAACDHDLFLNGACLGCGATEVDSKLHAANAARATGHAPLIPAQSLVGKRGPPRR